MYIFIEFTRVVAYDQPRAEQSTVRTRAPRRSGTTIEVPVTTPSGAILLGPVSRREVSDDQ